MLIGASALAKAGLKESEGKMTRAHQDTEDGRKVYEIELVVKAWNTNLTSSRHRAPSLNSTPILSIDMTH